MLPNGLTCLHDDPAQLRVFAGLPIDGALHWKPLYIQFSIPSHQVVLTNHASYTALRGILLCLARDHQVMRINLIFICCSLLLASSQYMHLLVHHLDPPPQAPSSFQNPRSRGQHPPRPLPPCTAARWQGVVAV